MVNSKKLIKMFRKWQRVAALGRRKILFAKPDACPESVAECTASVAEKGHFIVYSAEGKRFMVPLAYLRSRVFEELFRTSEDVFGLPGDGPITLPFDAAFIEYVLSLFKRRVAKDMERALISSISIQSCAMSSLFPHQSVQPEGCAF